LSLERKVTTPAFEEPIIDIDINDDSVDGDDDDETTAGKMSVPESI